MDDRQKDILEPFAQQLYRMSQEVVNLPDDQLTKLHEACKAASTTNCWAFTHHAAKYLLEETNVEIAVRKLRKVA